MFGLSGGHLILLVIIILLLFGARRLPELGSSLGKGIRAFKKGVEGIDQDDDEDDLKPKRSKKVAHKK